MMGIEQHAEAAADEIGGRYEIDEHWASEIVQAAIDKATAPLRARIEALEGLGPLIEKLEEAVGEDAMGQACSRAEQEGIDERLSNARDAIDSILKGGA